MEKAPPVPDPQRSTPSLFSKLKRILRLSSIYAAGDILTMGIGLILLPLYTAFLLPEEYGILAVATVVGTVAAIVLTLGLNGSALKFYYDLKGDERKRFYGSLWIFLIAIPAAVLMIIEVSGARFFSLVISQVPYSPFIRLALWGSFFTVAFMTIAKELLRASERAWAYTGLSVAYALLVTIFTAGLVMGLKQGAEGALWARLIAVMVTAVFSTIILRRSIQFSFDPFLLKKALLFSLPLLPHFLSRWVLHASDRIILERFVPLADVGIYAVGYQIGTIMMLFALAGNNSIIPMFGRLDVKKEKDVSHLMQIITYYILGLTFIGVAIALLSPEILHLISPAEYHSAARVVPWIVLGYLFMALYFPPMNSVTMILGKTRTVGFCTTGVALLNIGLNLWLIPIYGMLAAAVTTAIAYMVLFTAIFIFSRSMIPLPFEFRRISIILIMGLATFWIGWNLSPPGLWGGILTKGVSLLAFPVLLLFSGFFNQQERHVASEICFRFRKSARLL